MCFTEWSPSSTSRLANRKFDLRKTTIQECIRNKYAVYQEVGLEQRETVQIIINIAS
jgi:hypothetical protein